MPHRCHDASFTRDGNISKGINIRRLRIFQPFGIPSSSAGVRFRQMVGFNPHMDTLHLKRVVGAKTMRISPYFPNSHRKHVREADFGLSRAMKLFES